MDRREKAARLASLSKLRNRRNKDDETLDDENLMMVKDTKNGSINEEDGDYEEDDDMDDFIEETEEEKAERLRSKSRKAGPSISTFFKTNATATSSLMGKRPIEGMELDKRTLKDDFFKNLVAQLSEEEEEEEVSAESSGIASKSSEALEPAPKEARIVAEEINEGDMSASFPDIMPEANRLEINNSRAMELDEEDAVNEFPDDADLQQFEAEMSFRLESDEKPIVGGLVSAVDGSVPNTNTSAGPSANAMPSIVVTSVGSSTANRTNQPKEDDGSLWFYWFDAYERQPNGPLYLFGKIFDSSAPSGFASCCVIVEGLQRNLFFLPREFEQGSADVPVTFEALQEEVRTLSAQYGISKFGCKRVNRRYAFEITDVPEESEYLKLVYGYAAGPQLPLNLSGRTFSHVFGSNTNALEMLLIKRKIMGPCWLRLEGISQIQGQSQSQSNGLGRGVSWCRHEFTVTDPKKMSVLKEIEGVCSQVPPAPLLTAMSLSLRTILNTESKAHEIVAISAVVHSSIDIEGSNDNNEKPRCTAAFTVVRDLENVGFSSRFSEILQTGGGASGSQVRLEQTKSEKALLNYFIAMLQRHDPDILVGHNFLGFDLGVLLNRLRACKVDFWSKLGRLHWSQWPKARQTGGTEASWAERQIVSGRIVCDTYLTAKDLIKAKNYSLQTLVASQLGLSRDEVDYERVKEYFVNSDSLRRLLTGNERDAYFIAMLMFQMLVLPLTLQLTQIAGNLWSRTLMGARAERNEFLLLHEFHNQKYVCPDKAPFPEKSRAAVEADDGDEDAALPSKTAAGASSRRKPAYSGGLVLEPRKGFYDRIVLLLDFNSLYPSIIQEYNICFTTVERESGEPESNSSAPSSGTDELPPVPDSSLPMGLLPRILKNLVERRRSVKAMMKNKQISPSQHASLNIRQQALKLTANSMYGCLGFAHSRFYAKPLAMLITAKGREILQNTVNLTREVCQSDVIYGDTDSIMVHTRSNNLAEARALGQKIKRVVNERYRLLEIELDGIFLKLLLLKKKKYAAIVVEEERPDGTLVTKLETKGLDLVRRDWCELSVEASQFILNAIMNSGGKESNQDEVVQVIHESLKKVAADLQAGAIPLEKFIISKNLTKDPAAYADARNQPHVMVALRMRERGLTASSGDTIPYVICQPTTSSTANSLSECAHHPDEVRKDPSLRLDVSWYLQTQLHPPIARLCEHIEGTDAAHLAECLGLDPKKFRSSTNNDSSGDALLSINSSSSRFCTLLSDEERFAACEKLKISCPHCQSNFTFTGLCQEQTDPESSSAIKVQLSCPQCNDRLGLSCLYYGVLSSLKEAIDAYYAHWMRCDEVGCQLQTERMGVYDRRCPNEHCPRNNGGGGGGSLRPLLSPAALYTHLLYLRSLFSTEKLAARLAARLSPTDTRLLNQLNQEMDPIRSYIEEELKLCAYPVIDFKEIFSYLH